MSGNTEEFYTLLGVTEASSPHDVLKAYSSKKSQLEIRLRDTELSFDEKDEIFKEINRIRKAYQGLLASDLHESAVSEPGSRPEEGCPGDGKTLPSCGSDTAGQQCEDHPCCPAGAREPGENNTHLAAIHDINPAHSKEPAGENDPLCPREADQTARKRGHQDTSVLLEEKEAGDPNAEGREAQRRGSGCWGFCWFC